MPRRLTHTAAVALAAITGLGAAGCGGGGPSEEEQAAARQAEVRWQAGVPRWRADMVLALNEISLMLSDARTVGRLQGGDAQTTAQLGRFERMLGGCSVAIRRLGLAPGELEPVRAEALRACRSLERGARLVHDGVADWRAGRGSRQIDSATVVLGDGQLGLERVRTRLRTAAEA